MEASLAAEDHRQKALGAFYTPPLIAKRLADWAIRSSTDRVMDPSFGNLVFLGAASERLVSLGAGSRDIGAQLYGIDVDPGAIAAAAGPRMPRIPERNLIQQDFFEVEPAEDRLVDVVLGNPPYIRYQQFSESRQLSQLRAADQGVRLNGLASSWAAFVVHGATFLRAGGRMAQVLPAEILHAQYAAGVLDYLERSFERVTIAVFEERVFPGALEEVVLLFAEGFGSSERHGVQIAASTNVAGLDIASAKGSSSRVRGRTKLLSQLLPEETQELLESCRARMQTLGGVASVDIGIVTGANEFFTLTAHDAATIDPRLLRVSVSKAAHMQGATLSQRDHKTLLADGKPALMLSANGGSSPEALATVQRRIAWGEELGFHERFKCRIRDPWWALPSPEPPDLLLTYCSSDHPRLAVNDAGAIQTNTLHGVRVPDGVDVRQVAASFYNSATLLSCELEGRSYGGGVLKLEPTEAERVLLPAPEDAPADVLPEIDRLIRAKQLEAACDLVDQIVLARVLGLDEAEIAALRDGRSMLAARRRSRGARPRP